MGEAINTFLVTHDLRLTTNPCISPDFCLYWPALCDRLQQGEDVHAWPHGRFATDAGDWQLVEDLTTGDCAWLLTPLAGHSGNDPLEAGTTLADGRRAYPATWANLLRLKNLVLVHDAGATIFPTAPAELGRRSLGVGARFTTLHWPAVDWTMAKLGLSLTANQNSIPRELVYDVDAMLAGQLDTVDFPFIGTAVPEGHQGQSVEGMSHGAVLTKLKHGFHDHRLPWSFNADHQPIGGKFDAREDALVRGSLLASYITFDLSPELACSQPAALDEIDASLRETVRVRLNEAGLSLDETAYQELLCTVWPALRKMQRRDHAYRTAREAAFTTEAGCAYLRELSIDELPGLTTPATTAVMLALCEALDMPIHFIAPAFGFQKNLPYPDQDRLRELIAAQWEVCQTFGVSIGFHSGSGKSAENYRLMGEVTGSHLEIKTSGRYTYEMGRALHASTDPTDQELWQDWYAFTIELALAGAFSTDESEQAAARDFIRDSFDTLPTDDTLFASPDSCREALSAITPHPDRPVFFEYNFLYLLAAEGRADKAALGDHSPAGYRQRARFYAISDEARLGYARHVAGYLIFLAEHTGLSSAGRCANARDALAQFSSYAEMMEDIAPS
jgi:hypothetical protein